MQYIEELRPLSQKEIAEASRECSADTIYLHWTAGHYGQVYGDYHLSIDKDGRVYAPFNNLDFNAYRTHTYRRNSGAIAIALCGCYGGVANAGYNAFLGNEPVTKEQIESMAQTVATICSNNSNISLDTNVLTHCEIACRDGYGVPYGAWVDGVYQGDYDLRWDLWYLPDYDGKMRPGGDVIRGKARWYMNHM